MEVSDARKLLHKSNDAAKVELDRALRIVRDAVMVWWHMKGEMSCLSAFKCAIATIPYEDTHYGTASVFHGALSQMTSLADAGADVFASKEKMLFGQQLSYEERRFVFDAYYQVASLKIMNEKKTRTRTRPSKPMKNQPLYVLVEMDQS